MLAFWDVPFQPFIYVFLSLCSKQIERHTDTFNWLEFETSELECRRKYWSYELEVPEPLIRWGIIHPCTSSFKQVACVHAGYHAVRRYCKECLPQTCFIKTQLDGPTLRSSWACFADAFTVEASELGLITRKFSLTVFLDFLVNRQSHDFLGAFECGRSATPQELIRL